MHRHHVLHAVVLALVVIGAPSPAGALTRCEAITRAQSWVDAKVPYSQSQWFTNSYGKYRQDCSGFVSMAWELSSSMVTSTLPQVSTKLGSFADLQPGDAVNHTSSHVMLFKEWVQPGVSFKAYEERNYGQVAGIFSWTVSTAQSGGYAPYRLNGIQECCTPHCSGSKLVGADCGEGDCAAFGATCVDDALGARCASVFCPALGAKKVCASDKLIGDCQDGAITTGDCSKFGATCSTAGAAAARCVSVFCVASPKDAPVAHDVCLPDGRLAHCTADGGLANAQACGAGASCVAAKGSASCVAPPAAPTPAPTPAPSAPPVPPATPDESPAAGPDGTPPDHEGILPPGAPPAATSEGGELVGGCAVAGGGDGGGLLPSLLLLLVLGMSARARRYVARERRPAR